MISEFSNVAFNTMAINLIEFVINVKSKYQNMITSAWLKASFLIKSIKYKIKRNVMSNYTCFIYHFES